MLCGTTIIGDIDPAAHEIDFLPAQQLRRCLDSRHFLRIRHPTGSCLNYLTQPSIFYLTDYKAAWAERIGMQQWLGACILRMHAANNGSHILAFLGTP
jgi:hypothetical protein